MGVEKKSAYSMDTLLFRDTGSASQVGSSKSTTQPRRRTRTSFTPSALKYMETEFQTNRYPDIRRREAIATEIDVPEARVQVWFQNRRARANKRRKSTESQIQVKRCRVESPPENLENKTNVETVEMTASTQNPAVSPSLTESVPNGHQHISTYSTSQMYNQHCLGVNWYPSAYTCNGTYSYRFQPMNTSETSSYKQENSDVNSFLMGMFRFSASHTNRGWNTEVSKGQEVPKKPYVMTVPAKRLTDCSMTELQTTDRRSSDSEKLCADKPVVTGVTYEEEDSGFVFDVSSDSL